MSNKTQKYGFANLKVGGKIKLTTTPETSAIDIHRLRSAISQYKRLREPDASFEITQKGNLITCKRLS